MNSRRHLPALAICFSSFLLAPTALASELLDEIHDQQVDRVKVAIRAGANVNEVDDEGYFPLYYAIAYESAEITQLLLKSGADVHQKDPEYGMPMIAHAAAIGNLKVVEQLLRFKADPKAKDKFGGTAIEEAAYNGFRKIANRLVEYGAKTRWPTHVAAGLGDIKRLRQLIPKLDDINLECVGWKTTPLHFATSGGSIEACKMLLDADADPNRQNLFGTTALHIAADAENVPMIKVLLSHGADPRQRDIDGSFPGQHSENEVIQKLLDPHRGSLQR